MQSDQGSFEFIANKKTPDEFNKYNEIYYTGKYFDLSARNPYVVDMSIYEEVGKSTRILDLRENCEILTEDNIIVLLNHFTNITNIYIEEGEEYSNLKFLLENKEN